MKTGKFEANILIISGSSQKDGQSLKVAKYFSRVLEEMNVSSHVINLHELDLPLFGAHLKDKSWEARWQQEEAYLKQSNGVVLISPEYNGSASPALLNLMLYVGSDLSHKPVLPVGVSIGRGGAYPIANLRQNSYKDPAYVFIPESVIVSHVGGVLNDHDTVGSDESFSEEENRLREKIDKDLKMLLAYAERLVALGDSIA